MFPITIKNARRPRIPDRESGSLTHRFTRLVAGITALFTTVFAMTFARATSYVVDTHEDVVALDGKLSLREALAAANLNIPVFDAASGEAGPVQDSITFDPTLSGSTITLSDSATTISGLGWVIPMGGPLAIVDSVVISSGTPVTIDGGGALQIFVILQGADGASLSGLTLENAFSNDKGGALYVGQDEVVTLQNLTVNGSVAADGGGLYNDGGKVTITGGSFSSNIASGASGSGGAVFNATNGSLTITGTEFSDNIANRAGGAIEDQSGAGLGVTLTDVVFFGNNVGVAPATAAPGNGGALHITGPGDILITGGKVDANIAAREGGGLWNGSGTMTVSGTEILANRASGTEAHDGGGGIFNNGGTLIVEDLNLTGNVADGTAGSGGGIFSTSGAVTVTRVTLSGNLANRAGGGIELIDGSLALDDSTLGGSVPSDGNIAGPAGMAAPGNGGGLHVSGSATIEMKGGLASWNVAASEGGALWNQSGTTMTVSGGALISNNYASGDAADNGGGGIFNNGGTLVVDGAFIVENFADGASGSGGGILSTAGSVTMSGATVSANSANRAGGGIEIIDGTLTVEDSVLGGFDEIEGNIAGPEGSASPGNGGALHVSGVANVTIDGGIVGANVAAREGGGLWNQVGSTLTVQNGTLIDGNRASGPAADDGGGAIFNNGGTLIVDGSAQAITMMRNTADGASGSGGGIFSTDGAVTVNDTFFATNVANRAGGAIEVIAGELLLKDTVLGGLSALDANVAGPVGTAAPGNGGALHISGNANTTIDHCEVLNNYAAREGGGLWNQAGATMVVNNGTMINGNIAAGAEAHDGGGGIFNNSGIMLIEDSTIAKNLATGASGSGGGIFNQTDGSMTIMNVVLSDNVANRAGGAIEDNAGGMIAISKSLMTGNTAGPVGTAKPGNGGALHISGAGSVSIEASTVAMNTAANEGGGLWNSGAGTLNVRLSTVHSNAAPDGGGLFAQAGDGIFNVQNSTVSSNTATSGGGFQTEGGSLALLQVTVADNVSETGSGGAVLGGTVDLTNTIVAGAVVGPVVAKSSLIQDASGATGITNGVEGNITGVDPQLSSLNDFGGATETHFPMSSSPVVDAGDSASAVELLSDQRGFDRIVGNVDMGSVERQETEGEVMVTTFEDVVDAGDGVTSLREAIIQANSSATVDLIMLEAGTYALTITGSDEDSAMSGDLDIISNLTIMGAGAGESSVDASALGDRVFHVAASEASVKFSGLQIKGGTAADGGGILNDGGIVRVQNSAITDNVADGASGSGGGIFNQTGGQLFVSDSTISANRANRAGGGIEDQSGEGLGVTLSNVTLDNNNAGVEPASAAPGNGGGLHITGPGDIMITGGSANGNVAALEGGGLWNGSGVMDVDGIEIKGNTASGPAADDGGGGIFNNGGTLNVSNSVITANVADGASGSGGGVFSTTGMVSIANSMLTANTANRAGGGIELVTGTLNLDMVMLGGVDAADGNIAGPEGSAAPGNGGAFHISGSGIVDISGGFIESNVAAREGGGLWNQAGTVMTVKGGTVISNNTAKGDAADDGGAGIFNNGGELIVSGATIENNVATGASGSGGGIFNATSGTVKVMDSTIANNRANRAGGGIEDASGEGLGIELSNVELNGNHAGAAPGNGGGFHITGPGDALITGGAARGNTAAAEGGALWNGTGTMTVNGMTIDGNTASGAAADQGGGGLFNAGGTIKVMDATITNNVADGASGSGGGILNDAGGYVEVSTSDVTMNRANRAGGGIEDNSGAGLGLLLTNVRLDDNLTGVAPAVAAPGNGGGLHVSGPGDIQIRGGTADRNQAAREGGAIWNGSGEMWVRSMSVRNNIAFGDEAHDGGGGYFNNGGSLLLDEGEITGNEAVGTAGSGGGILSIGGIVSLDTATVSSNVANRAGGGIELIDGDLTLTNVVLGGANVFAGNIAGPEGTASPGNGGGLHISGVASILVDGGSIMNNVAAREGGGLWNQAGSTMTIQRGAVLSFNSASGNSADDGGGAIFNNGGSLVIDGSVVRIGISENLAIGDNARGGGILSIGGEVAASSVDLSGNFSIVPGSGFVQHDGVASLNDAMIDDDVIASGDAILSGAPVITGEVWTEGMAKLAPDGKMETGDITLAPQSTFAIQLSNDGNDQVAVSGLIDLGMANLSVSSADGFDTTKTQTFVIVENDGSDRITGAFNGLPEGAFFGAGSATLRISYRGGDGNDVTLTSGPAPGTVELVIDPLTGNGNGSMQQMVTVTNNSTFSLEFGRLLVAGLPEGVTLDGAAGIALWGSPPVEAQYVQGRNLAVGESASFRLTFIAENEGLAFTPSYTIVSDSVTDSEIVTVLRLEGGDILLEFTSESDTVYQVLVSEDLVNWESLSGRTIGNEGITTVIGSGDSAVGIEHPGSVSMRFYRVVKVALP